MLQCVVYVCDILLSSRTRVYTQKKIIKNISVSAKTKIVNLFLLFFFELDEFTTTAQ